MALRRISDLQNLASTYTDRPMTSKLNDCLIEVSYADPASPRAYQSFCLSVSELAKISPTDNFVTLDGNQTITGIKTFANNHGIIINDGIVKGSTNLSNDISSATESLSVVPTTWAVKTYLSSEYLPLTAFNDPSGDIQDAATAIESLRGLLNKHDLVVFVHKDSPLTLDDAVIKTIDDSGRKGIYDKNDTRKQKAVSSIYDALTLAKRIKFLEGGMLWIWLLSDCALNKPNQVFQSLIVEHPDINGTKSIHICGGSLDDGVLDDNFMIPNGWKSARYHLRKITVDLNKPETTLNNKWFQTIIRVASPAFFRFIVFDGKLTIEDFNNEWQLTNGKKYGTYTIANEQYGGPKVDIRQCYFTGHDNTLLGGNYYLYDVGFSLCDQCMITDLGRTYIGYGVNIISCYQASQSTTGAATIYQFGEFPQKTQIFTGALRYAMNTSGGIVQHIFTNTGVINSHPMGLKEDPNGTIIVDGVKYRQATQAEIQNDNFDIVNPNLVTLAVGNLSGDNDLKRYHPASATSTGIGNFLKSIGDLSSSGYTENGYVYYQYINAKKYLSCCTNTPLCYDFEHRWLPCINQPLSVLNSDGSGAGKVLSAINIDDPEQWGPFSILQSTDVFKPSNN